MKYIAIILMLLMLATCASDTATVDNNFNNEVNTYINQYETDTNEHIYFLKTFALSDYRYIVYKSSKDNKDSAFGYATFKRKSNEWVKNTNSTTLLDNLGGRILYSFGSSGSSSIKEYIIYGIVIDKNIQLIEIEFKDHSKKIIQVDVNNSVFSDFVRAENICSIHGLDGAKNIVYASNDMCK